MSKRKNIFNLSIFGLASLGLITGGNFLIKDNSNISIVNSYADTQGVATNSLPEYFKATYNTENITENDIPLVLYETSKTFNLSFDTKDMNAESDKTGPYLYGCDNLTTDKEWYSFTFDSLSISRDGQAIDFTSTGESYILTQTATTSLGTIPATQTFDLDIRLDTSTEAAGINGKTLTLSKEGFYTISIQYTEYHTTDGGANDVASSGRTIDYSFMFFNYATYLVGNKPQIEYSQFTSQDTSNKSIYDYSYYYNYTTDKTPYIKYDYTKFDLTISRTYNLATTSETIAFDNETNSFNASESFYTLEYSHDSEGNPNPKYTGNNRNSTYAYIYFSDLGEYVLDFDLVYTTSDYTKYYLNKDVNKQIAYVYGYQSVYTAFENNKNVYKEFKSKDFIESDFAYKINTSADVTSKASATLWPTGDTTENRVATFKSFIGTLGTPVSTNQIPVKLNENASLVNAYLYEVSISEEVVSLTETAINGSKNISTAGTYFIAIKYHYNNYFENGNYNLNKDFYQYFYFKIDNTTPSIDVVTDTIVESGDPVTYSFSGEQKVLSSGEYTNKNIYIPVIKTGKFDSKIIVKLIRNDFENNTTETIYLDSVTNITKIGDTDYYTFTKNGNYTMQIYYGKTGINGVPIIRKFNIDKTNISDIKAYGVTASGTNYKTTHAIDVLTNESLIFSWEVQKASGASTYGYYKYYPIESFTGITESENLSATLSSFLNKQSVPVDYRLNLATSSAWINYTNARNVENSSAIPSSYVRSGAGLYILSVYDEAGNMSSEIYFIDNTTPKFVLQDSNGNYSFLSSSKTLSTDATLYWGDYKVINISSVTDSAIYNDISSVENKEIKAKVTAFFNNYKSTFNNISSALNGDYLKIAINNNVLFKDLNDAESQFQFVGMNNYKIISSYSLYYADENEDGIYEYYYSTSVNDYYIPVSNPATARNFSQDEEAVPVYNIAPYEGSEYNSIFVREGSYQFVIRDASNTKGLSETDKNQYLNYSSAYQFIILSSDQSEFTLGYKEKTSDENLSSLLTADNASNVQNITEDSSQTKYIYYQPTSLSKELLVSFIPSHKDSEENLIYQLDYVHVDYYPFVNTSSSYYDNIAVIVKYNDYRDFSKEPTMSHNIYQYTDDDDISTSKLTFSLNSVNGNTPEGKYVITRKYIVDESKGLKVDKYDYKTRVFTIIVDRENVISESEVVSSSLKTYTKGDYTFKVAGSTLYSNTKLNDITDLSINESSDLINLTAERTVGGTTEYIYNFASNITSIKIEGEELDASSEEISQSTQSVVGSGILINMFTGDSLSVDYPNYKINDDEYTALNSGYTFYVTSQSFKKSISDVGSLTTTPITDKVPLKLYVPAYKYTLQHTEYSSTTASETKYLYKVSENDDLSYFRDDISIEYYELYAEVYRDGKLVAKSSNSTNGYLNFVSPSGSKIENFSDVGTYIVIITQAYNSVSTSTSFKNNYAFSFAIEESLPDFTIYGKNGRILDGPESTAINKTLYTNQDQIIAKWTDSADEFSANVDLTKIKIDTEYYTIDRLTKTIKKNSTGDAITFAQYEYNTKTRENILTIDLTSRELYKNSETLYQNGKSISISMILEHPNTDEIKNFYKEVTQTVYIDTTIYENYTDTSLSTVETLLNCYENLDRNCKISDLREFYDVDGQQTNDYKRISYAVSKSTGFYKYYAYIVDSTFISTLMTKITNNKNSTTQFNTTAVYIYDNNDDIYSGDYQETNYANFFKTSYIDLANTPEFSLTKGHYYEVVETDYAGNLLIYIIYCKDSTRTDALTYTSTETDEAVASEKAISTKNVESSKYNIYSSDLSAALKEINLYGDQWIFVRVEEKGIITNYVASPWLADGKIQNISTGEAVNISSIISNKINSNKIKIYLSDKVNGLYNLVYCGKSNTSSLNISATTEKEGISINIPSADILTNETLLTFPVKISVQIKNATDLEYQPAITFNNNPNDFIFVNGYSYQNSWTNSEGWVFNYNTTSGCLEFTYSEELATNSKVKYTIVDNFGKSTSLIHIVGSTFSDAITSSGYYYESYEDDKLFYKTQNTFKYLYNTQVYYVQVFDMNTNTQLSIATKGSITFTGTGTQFNEKYEIKVFDAEETIIEGVSTHNYVKSIYIHLYNMLPTLDGNVKSVTFSDENGNNLSEQFSAYNKSVKLNGQVYNISKSGASFANIIKIVYSETPTEIPYQGFILKEGNNSFEPFDSGYNIRESGIYYILFKYTTSDIFTNEYVLYKLEVLDSSSNFYYVTVDGTTVKAQSTYYYNSNNQKEYSNYYIVNVDYSNSSTRVKIVCNEYQKIFASTASAPIYETSSKNVTTVIYSLTNKIGSTYPTGVSPYSDYVVITYIAPTTTPVSTIKYTSTSGNEENLTNGTFVSSEKESSFDSLKIRWNKYYGIEQNAISIIAEKDGFAYTLPIYYESNYAYTYLTISGSYRLQFIDAAGNIQKFGSLEYADIIFLKDVHFTMITTETDKDGNVVEHETEAIDKAVFNSDVKLRIKNLSKYYTTESVGTGSKQMIHITRNGEEFTDYAFDSTTTTFTINQIGFYQVYFSAVSLNGTEMREQKYTFSIINPKEARYAYEYSSFEDYTIDSVIQNTGIKTLIRKDLKGNDLLVSYYDENTGMGLWTITINTNKKLTPGSEKYTTFSFSFLIRTAVPPVEISIKDGEATTSAINITFNAENIYNSVGDCIISWGNRKISITSENYAEIGTVSEKIESAGTYYIQVTTESGRLLYSYKVIKNDPLNTWAIIAIVIGSVVAVVVVIIVIKLRKRIKVK